MEKNPPEKFGSIKSWRKNNTVTPRSPNVATVNGKSNNFDRQRQVWDSMDRDNVMVEESFSDQHHNVDQLSDDIDRFIDALSSVDDTSSPPEAPEAVETYLKIVESKIDKFNSGETQMKLVTMTEDDTFFIAAATRISKLTNALSQLSSSFKTTTAILDRTSMVLQKAMSVSEELFCALLENSRRFNSKEESDRCVLTESEPTGEVNLPEYSPEVVKKMNAIATGMISAGYGRECCQVFGIVRRNAFNEALKEIEFEKISIDQIQRMQWEALEGQITGWIKVVKYCSAVLFPGESRLSDAVFSGDDRSISKNLFSSIARPIVIQFLDFAEAVGLTKRSAEKLFKLLDIHETLRDLIRAISESCTDDCREELTSEISTACDRIGDAAMSIFSDLENSIRNDAAKTPVPGGAVHPLTRYVMNYLKYACEYKDTLEHIFKQIKTDNPNENEKEKESRNKINQTVDKCSSYSDQLLKITDLLDSNLVAKSKLYRDPSLRCIFLMNNGRYILQKIKGSTEIHELMGDTWRRRVSSELRQYHKNYQRETWGKVLQCLNHEGLQVNGKVVKPVLKERFKNFSVMFEEIHKTQGAWVVTDEQLQSELRVSISAVVIPAYRSFVARFQQQLDSAGQRKYIKYQPEDIEGLIEELFDGNTVSMARRRM
ncbi:exocyst complex component EXO70C1 [Cornus florida]|uniref:exocyst complex component EXO70C1 n=1 Tax=Cornus florida TaxID=4283 RepID=UPI00289ED19B|nr:exocyst complex component EXO70C1 [Cornus florida]